MRKIAGFKKRITACFMAFVMVAGGVCAPQKSVGAASVSVELGADASAKTTTANSDGKVEISYPAPTDYDTTDELKAAGINKLQITFKVTQCTASGTAGGQAFINYSEGWESQWLNLSQGVEQTVTLDLSNYLGTSATITSFGIQFANITGSFSYQIISAKLIGPGTWDVENSNISLEYTAQDQYNSYTEYKFKVKNAGSVAANGDLVIKFDTNREKNWWTDKFSIALSDDTLTVSNITVPAGSSTDVIQVQLKPTGASIVSVSFGGKGISASATTLNPSSGESGGGSGSDYNGSLTYEVPNDCIDDMAFAQTPFGIHGQLNVNMETKKIEDKNGNPYQLRGISSHGINWGGNGEYEYEYINYQSIKNCRDILNANAIRLAMYTDEYNGYANGGSADELKYRVDKGVQCATALGMYAIVDWHILNSNPKTHIKEAKEFWAYASARYKDNKNVLYELCNEPTSGIWNDIKEYAETIIPIIRANDPDAIIIVGTPTWSQDVDIAMNNPLKDSDNTLMDNVMYTIHFYAAEHGESYRQKMKTAWNTIPIFCTEYGMCAASGDGANNFDSASAWLNEMDNHCISYFVWNLSEKTESSSLITHGSNAYNNWTASNLRESGQWIKTQYTARKNVNNTIPDNPSGEEPIVKKTRSTPVITKLDIIERTDSSITVSVIPSLTTGSYEFSFDGGNTWQSSAKKTGLSEATAYQIMVRVAEDDEYNASSPAVTAGSVAPVKVKTGTLLKVTDPYVIDISKLPGGSNYVDDTYLNALYITDNAQTKTPSVTLSNGKLTVSDDINYQITGTNNTITVATSNETPGGETPGGETPGGETPGEETPGDNPSENPGGETPGDKPNENPGGETPGGETPGDKPNENPSGDQPGQEQPGQEQPGGGGTQGNETPASGGNNNTPAGGNTQPGGNVTQPGANNQPITPAAGNNHAVPGGDGSQTTTDDGTESKTAAKIKIKASKKTVKVGKTIKLKATLSTNKKFKKFSWKSSNKKIAKVSKKGVVKGVKKGKAKITVIALDGRGTKATIKIKVK